jgi:hypothetical protein
MMPHLAVRTKPCFLAAFRDAIADAEDRALRRVDADV